MKNEVYLIRGVDCPVKQELIDSLSRGNLFININPEIYKEDKLDYYTDFLSGEDDVIIFTNISPKHIARINYFIEIFSASIKYSPVLIITTRVLNLKFKVVTQYITLERA